MEVMNILDHFLHISVNKLLMARYFVKPMNFFSKESCLWGQCFLDFFVPLPLVSLRLLIINVCLIFWVNMKWWPLLSLIFFVRLFILVLRKIQSRRIIATANRRTTEGETRGRFYNIILKQSFAYVFQNRCS